MNDHQSRHDDMNNSAREWRDEFNPGGSPAGEAEDLNNAPSAEQPPVPLNDRPRDTAPDAGSDAWNAFAGRQNDANREAFPAPEAPMPASGTKAPVTQTQAPEPMTAPASAGSNGETRQNGKSNTDAAASDNASVPLKDAESSGSNAKKPKKPSAASRIEPGLAEKCFNVLSWAGLPVLLVLVALVVFQQFLAPRALWLFDEVRAADVYMRFLGGDQLALSLNGVPYTDMPPLYFWFLKGLDRLPHVDQPLLFFLGSALSAMLYISAIWLLARATGHDRRTAFAAGLLALTSFFVMGLTQSPNADLLFAAVIALSLACFYRGWIKAKAPLWLTLAFLLTGAAALIKGPLALAFPLIASVLFLFWRGTPGRLNGRDGLFGFLLMLLLIGAWLVMLYAAGQTDYIVDIFQRQLTGRIFDAGETAMPWWFYLAALPLVCLPWVLLLLFVNWWSAFKGAPAAWRTRRENGGSSWLWISLVAGVALLSALSAKSISALLPLLAPLAVLAGRSLLRLTPLRSRFYFFFTALLFLLLGLGLVAAHYHTKLLPLLPADWNARIGELPPLVFAWLDAAKNLVCMGGVLIILALLLLFLCRRSLPGGTLLLCSVSLIVMNLPFTKNVAPSLESVFSPRAQAEVMAQLVRKGYKIAAYRVSPGAYAYYLNEALAGEGERPALTVPDLDDMARLQGLLVENDRVIVAMPEKEWNAWKDRPARLTVMARQWMVDEPCVLVKQDSPTAGEESSATSSYPAASQMPETNGSATPAPETPASEQAAPAPAATAEDSNPEGAEPVNMEKENMETNAGETTFPSPASTPDAAVDELTDNAVDTAPDALKDSAPDTPAAPAEPPSAPAADVTEQSATQQHSAI